MASTERKRPEAPTGAQGFLDDMMRDLDRRMRKNGTVPITAYLMLQNTAIIPFVFDKEPEDVDAKDGFADLLELLAIGLSASCVAIVMEAWSLRREDAEAIGAEDIMHTNLSAHPKRIEVLNMTCQWPGVVMFAQAEIKRRGDAYDGHHEPTWSTFHPDEVRSRFGDIIHPASTEERAAAREAIQLSLGPRANELFELADATKPAVN